VNVSVIDNENSAALPRKAIQVWDRSLFVASRTIWALSLPDHAFEAPDARESDGKKPRRCGVAYLMPGEAMQSDSLLSALSDGNRHAGITQQRGRGSWNEVEQIASTRRSKILILLSSITLSVILNLGVVSAKPILTTVSFAGPDVRENDPGIPAVVTAP